MKTGDDDKVEIVFQSYPVAVEFVPGPPAITMRELPPLPCENYIEYGRRVCARLGIAPVR